ncbi:uncharacterized protein RAG0_03891 [Rhynchosporium agropyri]|uniref:Uncharacterized protein n=1 Tax=Rhynchosporium agropyri TaxID=914238 RepID=A0A1E1K763_9HELO|nr:uncharacterized protein RAG0_03891 [Rhynchosporium agropyri]
MDSGLRIQDDDESRDWDWDWDWDWGSGRISKDSPLGLEEGRANCAECGWSSRMRSWRALHLRDQGFDNSKAKSKGQKKGETNKQGTSQSTACFFLDRARAGWPLRTRRWGSSFNKSWPELMIGELISSSLQRGGCQSGSQDSFQLEGTVPQVRAAFSQISLYA